MNGLFTHTLANGADVEVVYIFIDEDETVGLQAEFEISGRTLKSGQATANSVGVESIENFDKNAKCISENLAALEI